MEKVNQLGDIVTGTVVEVSYLEEDVVLLRHAEQTGGLVLTLGALEDVVRLGRDLRNQEAGRG